MNRPGSGRRISGNDPEVHDRTLDAPARGTRDTGRAARRRSRRGADEIDVGGPDGGGMTVVGGGDMDEIDVLAPRNGGMTVDDPMWGVDFPPDDEGNSVDGAPGDQSPTGTNEIQVVTSLDAVMTVDSGDGPAQQ
jgi:hypothetical protein